MECYIGTTVVKAEPMGRNRFDEGRARARGDVGAMPSPDEGTPGYVVVYEDGYTSWSPRETFERAYRRVTDAEMALLA